MISVDSTSPAADDRWLIDWNPASAHEVGLRLICLPYAGGGAAVFRRWSERLPDRIQVSAVELPGRGVRFGEKPITEMSTLVNQLADALADAVARPYALFGHSMGGLIAFELSRVLRRRGLAVPRHLFISGTAAPGTRSHGPLLHLAPVETLRDRLEAMNGTPPDVLANDELMELLLPVLRADFELLETYEYHEEAPLSIPITVFGGLADRVAPVADLRDWRSQATSETRVRLLPGDHFFLQSSEQALLKEIADATR